jgi:hypothetical protein
MTRRNEDGNLLEPGWWIKLTLKPGADPLRSEAGRIQGRKRARTEAEERRRDARSIGDGATVDYRNEICAGATHAAGDWFCAAWLSNVLPPGLAVVAAITLAIDTARDFPSEEVHRHDLIRCGFS